MWARSRRSGSRSRPSTRHGPAGASCAAVLDPNLLVAALLSGSGAPAQILSRWLSGEFELALSEALLAELERALAYPKVHRRIAEDEAGAFVELLHRAVRLAADPEVPARRFADPGDDYLLALAEQECAHLVSGDRHLLVLAIESLARVGAGGRASPRARREEGHHRRDAR